MKQIITLAFIFLLTSALSAQNVKTGGNEALIIKGFINATLFGQNQSFAFDNGQSAEWALPPEYTTNRWFYGGDVRATRLTMVFNGPEISNNWKLGGVLEFDAFGGFHGGGAFSAQQPLPRLRLAYVDIVKDNFTIRIGQAWTPLFGNVPVSLSHIAFPLGYGSAGFVGWRFPGIYLYYKFNSNGSPTHFSLDAAAFEGSWSGPGSNTNFLTAGNIGTPQIELRLNLDSKISAGTDLKAYIAGHYDKKDIAGVDVSPSINLTGTAAEFGASLKTGSFLIHGNVYTGKNIGQQFGHITQIQRTNRDLSSTGGWVQLGYNFTKEWGIFGFYGTENVDKNQAKILFQNNARLTHHLYNFMLKYETGPFALGMEWLHSQLTYGLNEDTVNGNQIAFSVLYKF